MLMCAFPRGVLIAETTPVSEKESFSTLLIARHGAVSTRRGRSKLNATPSLKREAEEESKIIENSSSVSVKEKKQPGKLGKNTSLKMACMQYGKSLRFKLAKKSWLGKVSSFVVGIFTLLVGEDKTLEDEEGVLGIAIGEEPPRPGKSSSSPVTSTFSELFKQEIARESFSSGTKM